MQDKVLIKPEDYHTLKKDDEVEIVITGTLLNTNNGFMLAHAYIGRDGSGLDSECIKEVYKLTPKATKLEVGEIITKPNSISTGWKVLHINKTSLGYKESLTLLNVDNDLSFNTNSKDMTSFEVFSKHTSFERKSGIPIDWEATFS